LRLLEWEAKEVFRDYGIPTPRGRVASTAREARVIAEEIAGPVAVKAQIPVGGRGRAGGILFAEDPDGAEKAAGRLLGSRVRGIEVRRVLVEEKLSMEEELYLGVVVDRGSRTYTALATSEGGIEIEEVAARTPERIIRLSIDPLKGLRSHHARWMVKQIGLVGRRMLEAASILLRLYRLAVEMDAELTEINPLALTAEGLVAADARLNVDDSALWRHRDLLERFGESELMDLTEREREARRLGLTYVELDGEIGIIGNGAGLTMATLDTVKLYGGRPANFLDLGGGAPADRVEAAVSFLLTDPRVKAIFINILGGITRCDEVARGIISAREKTGVDKPMVVRMIGTMEEKGRRLLEEADITYLDSMEEAARWVVSLAGGR
jgi:succinyl-CoA synthetase beta subunit